MLFVNITCVNVLAFVGGIGLAATQSPYIHAKISPENAKTTESIHITLAQLVLGSYELEAAKKAKQIEGQVAKPAPPAIEAKALPANSTDSQHLPHSDRASDSPRR